VRRTLDAKFQGLIYLEFQANIPASFLIGNLDVNIGKLHIEYKVVPSRNCLQETCCWVRAQPRPRLLGFVDEYLDLYCDIP